MGTGTGHPEWWTTLVVKESLVSGPKTESKGDHVNIIVQ